MQYQEQDLQRLHTELVDILKEIIRVCEVLNIPYFIQGGTAIGAFFNKGFVPWDDDIDLGMTRENYRRFIKEGPDVISAGYFIQSFETEPSTPFYFVKVRKNNTLFVEEPYKDMDIHHGIFVDVFPYDNVPDSKLLETIHRRIVQYCDGCFKRRIMKATIIEALSGLPATIAKPIASIWYGFLQLFPRRFFYNNLCRVQSAFNRNKVKFVSIVKMPKDQILMDSIIHPEIMEFEGVKVFAPRDVESYLRHHYPNLSPTLPKDKQINHAPYRLSFDA